MGNSYLLFHGAVEILTIAVATTLLILAWNTQRFLRSDYLKILGVGYGFIAILDLLHTLAFKGMGVFPDVDANPATQLWIAARYLQAFTLCLAPLFLRRSLPNRILVPVSALAVSVPTVLVFAGWFPDCYVEGQGLTPFKIVSEYVICGLFLLSIFLLFRNRAAFSERVFRLVVASIAFSIASELAFTSYFSVFSLANGLGHLLKLGAFYLLYRALIVVGFREPYEGIFRDLKQSETALGETLVERTTRLKESEARFRAVFEFSPLGKCVTDLEGQVLEANPALLKLISRPEDDPRAHNLFDWLDSASTHTFKVGIPDLLSGKAQTLRLEGKLLPKDRPEVEVEFIVVILPEDGGLLNRCLISVTDISARKEHEVAREKLHDQMGQAKKMEAIGLLAGGVAHDFNNMLGVILGRVQLAEQLADAGSPLAGQLNEIRRATERSAALTRQLLAFARKQSLQPQVLATNAAVEDCIPLLKRLVGEAIDVVWVPGDGVGSIKMDPGQLDQVLTNLCANARDAIDGMGTITIATREVDVDEALQKTVPGIEPGRHVVLSVSDNGIGMDTATKNRIFEPFFTTKEWGTGTGLGLASVYGIVKQNRGFITVYSEVGHGTMFRMYFPANQEVGEARVPTEPTVILDNAHETVLLIEDEPMLLEVVGAMLEGLGYTVLKAATPDEALRIAESAPQDFHLAVSDIVMPKMNGRDLARHLVELRPGLRVLFMSGYAPQGVEGFLQKPFTVRELTLALQNVKKALH